MRHAAQAHAPTAKSSLDVALDRFYAAVSKAQALGAFTGPHGPLHETAWIHVAIRDLERVESLARGALGGDGRYLAILRAVLAQAPVWDLDPDEVPRHPTAAAPLLVTLRQPTLVATAAMLIDRLTNPVGSRWVTRAMGCYALRATALNEALVAAHAVLDRRLSLEEFVCRVRAANFLGAAASHHEGNGTSHASGERRHGSGTHRPSTHEPHANEPPRSGRHEPHANVSRLGHQPHLPEQPKHGAFAIAPDAWTPLAQTLGEAFGRVIQLSGHATPALLEHLAAREHDADTAAALTRLAHDWTEIAPLWGEVFRPRPIGDDAPVVSTPEPQRCVPGQPQHGGRWDFVTLQATETDDACIPAEGLNDFGSRAYGHAGAELIKAQNEVVKAQLCYDDADKRRGDCVKWEDQGYEKCAEERDEGYNRCAAEEDRGHEECCDWWPCSWACDALVWIKNLVCVLWEWVSHIVCVAKTWIEKLVCVGWAYVLATGCAAKHLVQAGGHAALGLGGIVVGASAKTASSFVEGFCKIFGVKPESRTTTSLKVVGIHCAVLHTNEVMLFSYDEGVYPVSASLPADFTAVGDSDRALCALWNPATGSARYVPLKRNLFCAHQAFTEHGRLLVAGGQFPLPFLLKSFFPPTLLAPGADKDVHVFDPVNTGWKRLADMQLGRWYPTCVTLPDGRILVVSGTNGWATTQGLGRGIQNTWQIVDPRSESVGPDQDFGRRFFHLYPFMHVLTTGVVFIHYKRTTVLFDPVAPSLVRVAAGTATGMQTGSTNHLFSRTGPGPGTCVLLPLIPQFDPATGAVRYPSPRILILGGGGAEGEPEEDDPTDGIGEPDDIYKLHSDTPATATAEILDFATPSPQWRWTTRMANGRVMPDSVLLPNGKVLVVGGGRFGKSGGLLAHFASTDTKGEPDKGATDPVLEPEMFDPETETWELLCPRLTARLYHTTAVLLPDARVLVAGHDGALNMPPYDASRYELEVFSPPYLFDSQGQLAARTTIAGAPSEVPLGQRFEIRTPAARSVASVALIRQSSVTHQINTDQRYVGLAILSAEGDRLVVQAPPDRNYVPPGFYMLFLVDQAGVPSVARWMRVAAP